MNFIKNIYLTRNFFIALLVFAGLFVFAFIFQWLFSVTQILFLCFVIVILLEVLILFSLKNPVIITRNYPEKLSNGDENPLEISLENRYNQKVKIRVLEEIPIQFQKRNFEYKISLNPNEVQSIHYTLKPTKRGEYHFNSCNVFINFLGFIERKVQDKEPKMLKCYPSFIQLRKYTLMATTNRLQELGVKRIRRIGATLEFERVRDYSIGDDYRFINWKSTAKLNKLMVNQYEDEKSQPIYSIMDTGRAMRMPFEGLTLLDYAINSSLVLSNIALLKQDKAGILTFSKKLENHVVADKKNHQMKLISEVLYNVKTDFQESEFGKLYAFTKRNINNRSLIFIYTNFETLDSMKRQLPYLRMMNKTHVLVVVIFENTEIKSLAHQSTQKLFGVYNQIIAEKFLYEKQLIVQEIKSHGIQTILTEPKNLTVNSINKYLEVKSRGLI